MADVEKILEELLNSSRLRESATFTTRTYADQPIIQTGKQMRERNNRNAERPRPHAHRNRTTAPTQVDLPPRPRPHRGEQLSLGVTPPNRPAAAEQNAKIPERYYQLRELAQDQPLASSSSWRGALAYGTRSANRLFYEQAKLMEDFEDSFDFHGTYSQYFPTYSSMTLTQLRGYFSWRTRVRAGSVEEAPISFAFLYVYELLCGVGTTPGEQGLVDIIAFRDAFLKTDAARGSTFSPYLRRWTHDYVIYHALDPALLPDAGSGQQAQVLTLLRAEDATLKEQGLARKAGALDEGVTPTDEELLAALNECSSYQPLSARLAKDHLDDLRFVACKVFRSIVMHCSKRRKVDYVEGLFGGTMIEPYTMFSSAVFYEPEPHADTAYSLGPMESFFCKGGRWSRRSLCDLAARSKDLGMVLHAVDAMLRDRLDYPYPLKERPVATYVRKFITKAIDELFAQKEEEERRRITIDLSQLGHIRAVAAVTQEALLTDEERGDAGLPEVSTQTGQLLQHQQAVPEVTGFRPEPSGSTRAVESVPSAEPPAKPVQTPPAPAASSEAGLALSPAEGLVVQALLSGNEVPANPEGQMLSLVVDSVNEKFFDLVGDAIIEYEEDTPVLIEDYVQDVREIVGA